MDNKRLATPGAVLIFVGVLIMYWGLGIFRGETGIGGARGSKANPFPGGMKQYLGGGSGDADDTAHIPSVPGGTGGSLIL